MFANVSKTVVGKLNEDSGDCVLFAPHSIILISSTEELCAFFERGAIKIMIGVKFLLMF